MKPARESLLSKLDSTVRWTGIAARVADDMADPPSTDHKHRPLRWIPIWPIVFSCAIFFVCVNSAATPDLLRLSIIVGLLTGQLGVVFALHTSGPLGKPSLEDDERESALRKSSFLFSLGSIALLNCLGQPVLMILAQLQSWQIGHSISVAASAFMLNATLFGCLPTLHASWTLRKLPTLTDHAVSRVS